MTSESLPPPPPSGGGGAKYAAIGVVLAAIAGGAYFLTAAPAAPPPAANTAPDAGVVERSTALADDTMEIPEAEPDAGPPPDAGTAVAATPAHEHHAAARSFDDCSGDLPVPEIRRVVQETSAQIRNCYERQLKQNPMLQGSMELSIRVAADGHVDGTQVGGSLRDRDVFSCVRGVASHMRFPAPGGHDCALVRVPFNFTPSSN